MTLAALILLAIDYSALNTWANLGTFLLLLASVIAAAVSLHHAASFNPVSYTHLTLPTNREV